MKRIAGTIFAVFLTLVLFFVMLPVVILPTLVTGQKTPEIPSLAVLELDLGGSFTDQPHRLSFDAGTTGPTSIIRVVEALAQAEGDARVSGLFVTLSGETDLSIAQAEEIRDALRSFRARGKFVTSHVRNFYPDSLGVLYATSESDELWMPPEGRFASLDTEPDTVVADAMLNSAEVTSAVDQQEEYKSAVRTFAQSSFSDLDGDTYRSLVQIVHDHATAGIASSRGISPAKLRGLLQEGTMSAPAALASGLISRLGPLDEARDEALQRAGEGSRSVVWSDYLTAAGTPYGEGDVIAVVYAEGLIESGQVEHGARR